MPRYRGVTFNVVIIAEYLACKPIVGFSETVRYLIFKNRRFGRARGIRTPAIGFGDQRATADTIALGRKGTVLTLLYPVIERKMVYE